MTASASRSSGLEIPFLETEPVREAQANDHSQASPRVPLEPGAWIAGRYRVLRKIGEGGMGVLYACQDNVLSREVAVKLLQRGLANEPQVVERLMREARLAAQLHQHVAQVFDCGTLDTGEPFIVMELLSGRDLYAILRQSGPFSADEVTTIALEVCAGLAEAHEQGIVHRDLKPENLFRANLVDGSVAIKILDFGVSKQISAQRMRSQTSPTESVGSPQYMSPEQITSPSEIDSRTDIWSLGVVMFELLTGSLPFNGSGTAQICASVLTDPTPELARYRPDIPPALDLIIRRCLEKNREQRFATARDLAWALNAFRVATTRASGIELRAMLPAEPVSTLAPSPLPELAIPAVPAAELVSPRVPSLDSDLADFAEAPPPRRRRWIGALLSVAVLGACVGVLSQGVRQGRIHVPSQAELRRLPERVAKWGRSLPIPPLHRER